MPWKEILGMGSGIINGVLTDHYNEKNASRNQQYWEEQAKQTFGYNEKAADNAMNRSIKMYNMLQSPSAMVKQLKEAGLNPALMYSNSGMGGKTTSAPQGGMGGASGAPSPLGLQNFIDPLTMAQIKKTEAETRNINANTGLTEAQTKTEEWVTKIKGEEYEIASLRKDYETHTLGNKIEKTQAEAAYAIELANGEKFRNDINTETYEAQVQTIVQNSLLVESRVALIKAEKNLTDEQIKETAEKIKLLGAEIALANANEELTDEKKKELQNKYEWDNLTKEDAFRIAEIGVDAIETILNLIPNKKTLEKVLQMIAGNKTNNTPPKK